MAKQIVLDVLESSIGKYIRNLDAKSLNIAIWKGKIELHSLEWNENVSLFGLGVERGTLSSVVLDIPWTKLTTTPVVLSIHGLDLCLKTEKENELEEHNAWRLRKKAVSQLDTFGSRLLRRILENMQIEIHNIRVCIRGRKGDTMGFKMDTFSMVTTDAEGTKTFVNREENAFLHKAWTMDGFAVYLTDNDTTTTTPSSFCLEPLALEARVRQSNNNEYLFTSKLPLVSIVLNKSHFIIGNNLLREIMPIRPLFPFYRPRQQADKRAWWKYAYRCVLRSKKKRLWMDFFEAFRMRRAYVALYKRQAHAAPWMQALSVEERQTLEDLEKRMAATSMDALMMWRDMADAQAEKEEAKHKTQTSRSFFFSLFRDDAQQPPIVLTAEEMSELEAVTMREHATTSSNTRLCDANFSMGSFRIKLSRIASLEMGPVSTSLIANTNGSYDFGFHLSTMKVRDYATPNSLYPIVLQNMNAKEDAFSLCVRKNERGDRDVSLDMVAFEAVASPQLAVAWKDFFPLEDGNPLLLESHTGSTELFYDAHVSDTIASGVQGAWMETIQEKANWTIQCLVRAPILVVPENCLELDAKVMIFDMGRFRLECGSKQPSSPNIKAWFDENKYAPGDSGTLSVENMSSMVGTTRDFEAFRRDAGKQRADQEESKPFVLIDPIAATLNFGVSRDAKHFVVHGSVPSITMQVSPSHCMHSLSILSAWNDHLCWSNNTGGILIVDRDDDWIGSGAANTVAVHASAEWNQFSVVCKSDDPVPQQIAVLDMGLVTTCFDSKDDGSFRFRYSLSSLVVRDCVTTKSLYPNVFQTLSQNAALTLSVDKNQKGDYAVATKLVAFRAIASPDLIGRLRTLYDFSERKALRDSVEVLHAAKDRASSALANAWKAKINRRTTWSLRCDIHAPILVIPENCCDQEANAMVFNFGHFSLGYGAKTPSRRVQDWFEKLGKSIALEAGSVSVKEMMFTIEKSKDLNADGPTLTPVIEPITAQIDFGIGSFAKNDMPRVKICGSVPSVSVRISPRQVTQAISVMMKWKEHGGNQQPPLERVSRTANNAVLLEMSLALRRLSVHCLSEEGDGMEGHLVSITMEHRQLADGSTSNKLCMGWFWILDGLRSSLPRRQRLVVHSRLPQGSSERSQDILENLKSVGVLDEGSSDLATIAWTTTAASRPVSSRVMADPFSSSNPFVNESGASVVIDAKFSALFLHWNPQAVKSMTNAFSYMTTLIDEVPHLPSPQDDSASVGTQKPILIKASMQAFEIKLNSALDDLPLFALSLDAFQANILSSQSGGNVRMHMELGNAQVATVGGGNDHKIMVGLDPSSSARALTMDYYAGRLALKSASHYSAFDGCTAYTDIKASSVKGTYVQAQAMLLMNYCADGVLGALAKQAATSTQKAFTGKEKKSAATLLVDGIDIVLPRAANRHEEYFFGRATKLTVEYHHGKQNPGDGTATIALHDLKLYDRYDNDMIEQPLQMTVAVTLPSELARESQNLPMHAKVGISSGAFVVTKDHYHQILKTFEENISGQAESQRAPWQLSHAGTDDTEKTSRIVVEIAVGILSLELCNAISDPICRLAALKTSICAELDPSTDKMTVALILHDMSCVDRRPQAVNRRFQSLVEQTKTTKDFFVLSYVQDNRQSRENIKMKVGSPRFYLIPDVIAEIMVFFEGPSTVVDIGNLGVLSTKTTTFSFSTEECRVILVDLGSTDALPRRNSFGYEDDDDDDPWSGDESRLTETIVIQGQFESRFKTVFRVNETKPEKVLFHTRAKSIQVFTAVNEKTVQILEPASIELSWQMQGSETKFRAIGSTALDVVFSTQNAALFSAILSSLNDSLDRAKKGDGRAMSLTSDDAFLPIKTPGPVPQASVIAKKIKLVLPETRITVINDLQGLDEPLARATAINLDVTVEASTPGGWTNNAIVFNAKVNTALAGDFFDLKAGAWTQLLAKPWVVSAKGSRGPGQGKHAGRYSSVIELDSCPCHFTFSDQFLASLASTNRLWSMYAKAIGSISHDRKQTFSASTQTTRKASAARAARNIETSSAYAIDNFCGSDLQFAVEGGHYQLCRNGCVEYLRFRLPRGNGCGGRRLYGQEATQRKKLTLQVGLGQITIIDFDREVGKPKRAHELGNGGVLITHITKKGKSKVIHVGSHVQVSNATCIPMALSIIALGKTSYVGVCQKNAFDQQGSLNPSESLGKVSEHLSLPFETLGNLEANAPLNARRSQGLCLTVSPLLPGPNEGLHGIQGDIIVPSRRVLIQQKVQKEVVFNLICARQNSPQTFGLDLKFSSPFMAQVLMRCSLVEQRTPFVEIVFAPRAVIRNTLPVRIALQTPMPHTYTDIRGDAPSSQRVGDEEVHMLDSRGVLEVFSAGLTVSISLACSDAPMMGSRLGWIPGKWVDLQMSPGFRWEEPKRVLLPFEDGRPVNPFQPQTDGIDVFITELTGNSEYYGFGIGDKATLDSLCSRVKLFQISMPNYAADHTNSVAFEWIDVGQIPKVLGVFPMPHYSVTLLPGAAAASNNNGAYLRIVELTHGGSRRTKQSQPFRVDEIPTCNGGMESASINWDEGTVSGLFFYRSPVGANQTEIHIVPEYILFNGSTSSRVTIRQQRQATQWSIEPGQMAPVPIQQGQNELILWLHYTDEDVRAGPLRVDEVKHRVAVLKSSGGWAEGLVAVQTVAGSTNSRLVIKLGELQWSETNKRRKEGFFDRDVFCLRFGWSELLFNLTETKELANAAMQTQPVLTVALRQFTVDYQRIFAQNNATGNVMNSVMSSSERSQVIVIIHSIQIHDKTAGSEFPLVLDYSSSSQVSFLDLRALVNGPLREDMVRVDQLNLNLVHKSGQLVAEKIKFGTSEDFIWKLLDVMDVVLTQTRTDVMKLEWNDNKRCYDAVMKGGVTSSEQYTAPRTDMLLDIKRVRVSPFTVLASFKRQPQEWRYQKNASGGTTTAKIFNHFVSKVRFRLDGANLSFERFDTTDVRGPPSRLLELLGSVYASKIKQRAFSIIRAASFQDWKLVAGRSEGDDEYVEGDMLRASGALVGRATGSIAKVATHQLGDGLGGAARMIGSQIQGASEQIGARSVGVGVNAVVTGIGEGVGGAVKGVGTGAEMILKGAGKGVGQIMGGAGGAVLMAGKGITGGFQKGGDGAVHGLSNAARSVGTGVSHGVGSAVTGAAGGVMAAGHGLFSGARSVGKGILGGAFGGGNNNNNNNNNNRRSTQSPRGSSYKSHYYN